MTSPRLTAKIGDMFGILTVTAIYHDVRNGLRVRVVDADCECGAVAMCRRLTDVVNGSTSSCGCRHKESAKRNRTKFLERKKV